MISCGSLSRITSTGPIPFTFSQYILFIYCYLRILFSLVWIPYGACQLRVDGSRRYIFRPGSGSLAPLDEFLKAHPPKYHHHHHHHFDICIALLNLSLRSAPGTIISIIHNSRHGHKVLTNTVKPTQHCNCYLDIFLPHLYFYFGQQFYPQFWFINFSPQFWPRRVISDEIKCLQI